MYAGEWAYMLVGVHASEWVYMLVGMYSIRMYVCVGRSTYVLYVLGLTYSYTNYIHIL